MCGTEHALTTAQLHANARHEGAVNVLKMIEKMSSVRRTIYYLIRVAHLDQLFFASRWKFGPDLPS